MDRDEFLVNNFDKVDGYNVYASDVSDVLKKLSGIDEEEIEDGVYYLHTTGTNPYNHNYHRALYQALAVITDRIQGEEYSRIKLSERLEKIFNSEYYSASEIENDILIDPCCVIERLLDHFEKGE